jgi:hypothetical protein
MACFISSPADCICVFVQYVFVYFVNLCICVLGIQKKRSPGPTPVVVSVHGGQLDGLIAPSLAIPRGIVRDDGSPAVHFHVGYTTGQPGAHVGADHRCVLWCRQVVEGYAAGLAGWMASTPGARGYAAAGLGIGWGGDRWGEAHTISIGSLFTLGFAVMLNAMFWILFFFPPLLSTHARSQHEKKKKKKKKTTAPHAATPQPLPLRRR